LVAPEKEPGVKGAKIAVPLHVSADPVREIVHDFQARISAIKNNIDLIEAAGEITDKQKTFAQRAHLILSSMLIQVYEILDMSWLEMSGQLNRQPTDLNEIARRAVMHLEDYAQRSEVDITLDLMDGGCFVEGDERRLGSAVGNLVSNAIKYSPNGGPVRVAVRVEDDQAIVRVEDQGIGIPAEHLATLFQWFVRIRTPETRRISGTGLGLAIVKAVVEKHGGNVFAESVYGEGSLFGFSLPLPPRPNPRRRRPEKTASRGKRARSTAPAAPQ
jgi:signal transduction histidine kinase